MTLFVIILYLCLVLSIGVLSHRLFRNTGEDYFVASRSIGPFVLLMSLFGTHMTAFSILGASGEAYRQGIGVFALMASSSAMVIPVIFFFVGTKIWSLGKRHGYLTQIQFFRDRWESDKLGALLFVVLAGLLIPYLLIGVIGAGLTFKDILGGGPPTWVGSVMICCVIFFYVSYSGMRGTAWVNTFQTLVFMILGTIAVWIILKKSGGLAQIMATVGENRPELLVRGDKISSTKMLTYLLIPISAGMFPHIFTHWLTAKRVETFKAPIVFYPFCMIAVWVPSVLLGIIGIVDFPNLEGPAANSVLVMLVEKHAPGVLGGLLAAGIFAAIMSSLDSQTLSLGNMFTQDVVRHYKIGGAMSDRKQVLWGRIFVFGILVLTFILSQIVTPSIFRLGIWSFTGYASLFPLVVAALYWRRSTKWGAYACILTVVVGWIYFFSKGPPTVGSSDIMAVAVIMAASTIALIVVSLLTPPPKAETLKKFFAEKPS